MLHSVIQPVFARHLGEALYPGGFRLVPAVLFYLTYMGGVIWFAAWPALRADAPHLALLNGAILGLVAYGTYEFTSWAVMRDWHPQMVALDVTWGVMITALSAWGGVMVVRMLLG
jgi:uncharacterized membrane protein